MILVFATYLNAAVVLSCRPYSRGISEFVGSIQVLLLVQLLRPHLLLSLNSFPLTFRALNLMALTGP